MGYPKQVHDQAWKTLEERAARARAQNAQRRSQALEKVPEIADLERQMALGATGITRAVITAPEQAGELIEELARQNLSLQERRRGLLMQHGFAPDYLEEQFGCPLCRDQGYRGTEMCACLRGHLEQAARAQLSAAAPVDRCTFSHFQLDYYPETPDESGVSPRVRMEDIMRYCQRYAQEFDAGAESLLLIGRTGLGKTHLSLAMASSITQRGYGVIYTPVQKLMDTLEAEKFSWDTARKEQYTEHMRVALQSDLLVLDDLGTEFVTQFSTSVLYNIINTRQVEGRPTIISTNLDLQEIEKKYSQRMISRLVCAYQVLKFTGKDIRFIQKAQNR